MDESIICLDSSDDEVVWIPDQTTDLDKKKESAIPLKSHKDDNTGLPRQEVKRIEPTLIPPIISKLPDPDTDLNKKIESVIPLKHRKDDNTALSRKLKRIKPTLITPFISKQTIYEDASDDCYIDDSNDNVNINEDGGKQSRTSHPDGKPFIINENEGNNNIIDVDKEIEQQEPSSTTNNSITESFTKLIDMCRLADPSTNMEQLINKKLIKYYHMVKSEFIYSESFQKIILSAIDGVQSNPKLAYLKLSDVLAELYHQQEDGESITNDDMSNTGDERRDDQLERLNKALYEVKKQIYELETSEVDLADEENSPFILMEKYKKRACQIYDKICQLSGENKNTPGVKPITFNGTKYKMFNKTIQTYLNKTGNFPDLKDVVRILEFCNRKYKLQLVQDEMQVISEETFVKIGQTLQKRRKLELFKSLNFYSEGLTSDPATEDANLQSKLDENRKHYASINDVINKYAALQEKSLDISTSNVDKYENNGEGTIDSSVNKEVGTAEKEAGQKLSVYDPPMIVITSSDE